MKKNNNSIFSYTQFQMNVCEIVAIFVMLCPTEMRAQCTSDVSILGRYALQPQILEKESGILVSPGYPKGVPERVLFNERNRS